MKSAGVERGRNFILGNGGLYDLLGFWPSDSASYPVSFFYSEVLTKVRLLNLELKRGEPLT